MAAHIAQPTTSRRFIKIYLGTWGLLAVGSLCYLAVLAFPPQAGLPPQAAVDPPPSSRPVEPKVVPEVRVTLSDVPKDGIQPQNSVGERVPTGKAVEERVAAVDGAPPPAAEDAPDKAAGKDPAATVEAPAQAPVETAPAPIARPPFVPIETGSIAPKDKESAKEEIVFGAPVVTRAGKEFAVQLAAAPSLNALRQSWGQLTERHASALGTLQPRVVSPRSEGGIYRLLAGPLATKADAERICSELRVGPKACFATPYTGAPL